MFFDEGHGYDVFGLHPPKLAAIARALHPIYARYFRVRSEGYANIPARGPAILVANHSGALPIDGALLWLDVLERSGGERVARMVADHFVPGLPIVSTLFARCGVVSGTPGNVSHLLARGELVIVFPEGVSGPAKPFRERYRLQRWEVGFAELALRYRAPVVPVSIIGIEESWPVAVRLRGLRAFGSPYLPIPLTPVPLPARVAIRYGAPIVPALADPDDPEAVHALAAEARGAVAALVATQRDAREAVFR